MFDFDIERGQIRAYGPIGDYEGGISELHFMQAFDQMDGQDVNVTVQSEGGSVTAGLSIFNQIEAYSGSVTVQIDAIAASIAAVFPMAADRIVANSNSMMMIHDPWTMAIGNAREFRGLADVLDMLADGIADTFAAKTGKTREYWRGEMEREQYYSAQQALEIGLIDQIAGDSSEPSNRVEPVATVEPTRKGWAAYQTTLAAARLRMRHLTGQG